jgi:hypothetical protein
MKGNRSQQSRFAHLGGVVSVTPIRDRSGEHKEVFSISWHSPGGDLRWLSRHIPTQEGAEIAADVLSDFVRGAKQ